MNRENRVLVGVNVRIAIVVTQANFYLVEVRPKLYAVSRSENEFFTYYATRTKFFLVFVDSVGIFGINKCNVRVIFDFCVLTIRCSCITR